jgi:hypothetical protein
MGASGLTCVAFIFAILAFTLDVRREIFSYGANRVSAA